MVHIWQSRLEKHSADGPVHARNYYSINAGVCQEQKNRKLMHIPQEVLLISFNAMFNCPCIREGSRISLLPDDQLGPIWAMGK